MIGRRVADREIDRCSMQGEKEWEEAVGRKRLKCIHVERNELTNDRRMPITCPGYNGPASVSASH